MKAEEAILEGHPGPTVDWCVSEAYRDAVKFILGTWDYEYLHVDADCAVFIANCESKYKIEIRLVPVTEQERRVMP